MKAGNDIVDNARQICYEAHKGQYDKAGKPYYLHPETLAKRLHTPEEMATALLHDVVEDGGWSLDELRKAGIPNCVVEAVALLTHNKDVPYMEYIKPIKTNELARAVKVQDLKHNLDLNRLKAITLKDIERCRKYLDALEYLYSE